MAEKRFKIDEDTELGSSKIVNGKKWILKNIETFGSGDNEKTFGVYKKQGAFSATSEKIGEQMDKVLSNPKDLTKLLIGLNTITESSRMTPLSSGRVKTPIGQISTGITKGLIQGKQIETAETAAKARLAKAKQKAVSFKEGVWDKTDIIDIQEYNKAFANEMKTADAKENRYLLLKRFKDYEITGRVQKLALPFREFFVGLKDLVGTGDLSEQALNAFVNMDAAQIGQLDQKDIIKFQQELQAYTMKLVIGEAKNLYPVSENDVQRLLDAAGNVGTISAALKTMVSLDKAALEMQELYKEGVTIYRSINTESAAGKVTAEGATGTDWRSFAKDYAEKKIAENHSDVTQSDVNKIYPSQGTKPIDIKSLTPLQLASVAWGQDLLSFDLGAVDQAVQATWIQETREKEKNFLENLLNQ